MTIKIIPHMTIEDNPNANPKLVQPNSPTNRKNQPTFFFLARRYIPRKRQR